MSNTALYLDIHALQAVPPSCINRDDTGSPKTAYFGGKRRARVSSQAWKKAIRSEFANLLDEDSIGHRTKHVVGLIAEQIVQQLPDVGMEEAVIMATAVLKATGIGLDKDGCTKYLVFISPLQVRGLAKLAVDASKIGEKKINARSAKSILNPKERPTLNAIDIALFGRMVADSPMLNVDAACQVAHAIGVGVSEPEFDYYTAMDDLSPEDSAGAGMIGTIEYLSATLYRYATVDVAHLYENLGSIEAASKAAETFIKAFVTSMPTGRQNTFANRTLPAAVVIQIRTTQPVSLSGAFELPVFANDSQSITEVACMRLARQSSAIDSAFGTSPTSTLIVCGTPGADGCLTELNGEFLTLGEAVTRAGCEVENYLRSRGYVDGK